MTRDTEFESLTGIADAIFNDPARPQEIEEHAALMGGTLPPDLVRFWLITDGYRTENADIWSVSECFLSNVEYLDDKIGSTRTFAEEYLMIGDDFLGNTFVVRRRGEDRSVFDVPERMFDDLSVYRQVAANL